MVGGTDFTGLAGGAVGQIGANRVVEAWPVEVAGEAGDGLGNPEVAGDGDVVGFL